jgi:predicted AAA+ superfamily ATPase
MFEEAYLIHLVPRFGKTNEAILSPKKIYSADLGIRNLFTGFRDKGAVFENVVFSMIKHKHPSYVYQDATELDFLTQDKCLIEVKYGQKIKDRQKKLFEEFPAAKKIIIEGYQDLVLLADIV